MNITNTAVLTVTADGEFQWHEDADRMIEEGDFTASPSMQHILRALRKQQRKPLSREVIDRDFHGRVDFVRAVEDVHNIKGDA